MCEDPSCMNHDECPPVVGDGLAGSEGEVFGDGPGPDEMVWVVPLPFC